jgi:subtilisin family serine protease
MRLTRAGRLLGAIVIVSSAACGDADETLPSGATASTYLVVYAAQAVPKDAAKTVVGAGGAVAASYGPIGVLVARSASPTFRAALLRDARIAGAQATAPFATPVGTAVLDVDDGSPLPAFPTATDSDDLSGLQWDMAQIGSPAAHAIEAGDPSVVVADIDSGVDWTHPDLAPNFDFADSASCLGGVPDTDPSAYQDDLGFGTHQAGIIAAASNGIGIVGVAPNVKIAAIRAGDSAGFFYPEAVVCAFMWAGAHHVRVANASFFADPWQFNCRNDPTQRAIWTAERRAIAYAQAKGVLVVASEGSQADDLAHPTADATSPDDSSPVLRQIHDDCAIVPVEVPGVVGVTADGDGGFKSFYSSYGVGTADVMAPGGDSILQRTAASPNGRVLSTWPAAIPCLRSVTDAGATYCYVPGTTTAAPHVAGVAALLASQGMTSPPAIAARIAATADAAPCPSSMSIYDFFPALDNGAPQVCTGGATSNSFAGHGRLNALRAVSP